MIASVGSLWKCPNCGRRFANRNQWHSCVSYSVDDHFRGKPAALKETFDFLLQKVGEFGHVRVDAVKTSINIAAKSHFAGVQVLKTSLKLGFMYDRPLDDKRILSSQQLSDTNWSHTVSLAQKADVDAQLLDWLRHAYSLGS